jgi:hypothetical protein
MTEELKCCQKSLRIRIVDLPVKFGTSSIESPKFVHMSDYRWLVRSFSQEYRFVRISSKSILLLGGYTCCATIRVVQLKWIQIAKKKTKG